MQADTDTLKQTINEMSNALEWFTYETNLLTEEQRIFAARLARETLAKVKTAASNGQITHAKNSVGHRWEGIKCSGCNHSGHLHHNGGICTAANCDCFKMEIKS